MSRYLKVCAAFLMLTFPLGGCGYREGVLVKEPVSYLWFTGNIEQAYARIDDKEPFEISGLSRTEGSSGSLIYYQIAPGKHRITVEKARTLVVDRILYIGNGTIQEIQLP